MTNLSRNFLFNKVFKPVSFEKLRTLPRVEVVYFNINKNVYKRWIESYFPSWSDQFGNLFHKKLIELFFTFTLLNPQPDDVFMDVAGGITTYVHKLECNKKFLLDIKISSKLKSFLGEKIEYIESDAGDINLPGESIDKISCHHSLEHFQSDSDILFMKETQRLLKPDGKCCIIPIFIAHKYAEVTDAITFKKKFDNRSKLLIDPTATLPGGKYCGNYARVYDLKAFQERILKNIDVNRFKLTIAELRMEGEIVPDLTLDCHKRVAVLNCPYRAMVIERIL